MKPESEHSIQSKILIEVSKHGCKAFRANVGIVRLPDGRFFSTGLPNGFPDIFGFRQVDGKIFFIEVKNKTGKAREDQLRFHHMLTKHNIIHGLARNVQDALMIVEGGLIGYGFYDYMD